jgi:YHS domain-containing protein
VSERVVLTTSMNQTTMRHTRSNAVDHARTIAPPTSRSRWGGLAAGWRFTRHLGEMLLAMFFGMAVLGLAVTFLGEPPGDNTLLGGYAYMGLAMTLPMVAWMRRMSHPWKDCAEMSAAMLVPMFALVLPVALGVRIIPGLSAQSVMMPAHGAMIAGMILLMLYRWDVYAHGAHCHHAAAPTSQPSNVSATDPVCGMAVDQTTSTLTAQYQGQTYHFCSLACQKEFEDDPSQFLATDASPAT